MRRIKFLFGVTLLSLLLLGNSSAKTEVPMMIPRSDVYKPVAPEPKAQPNIPEEMTEPAKPSKKEAKKPPKPEILLDIPMVQKSFNSSKADTSTVKEFYYNPRAIFRITTREAMSTTIVLPEGEIIKRIAIGDEGNNIQYNNIVTKITIYENILNSNNIPKYSFTVTQNANYQHIIKENKTDLVVFSSNAEPSKLILEKRTNQEVVDKILSNQITILKEQKYNIELNIKSAKEGVLLKPNSNNIASLAQDILHCKKALESFHDNPTYWAPKSKGFDKEVENINKYFGKDNYLHTSKTLEKQSIQNVYSR